MTRQNPIRFHSPAAALTLAGTLSLCALGCLAEVRVIDSMNAAGDGGTGPSDPDMQGGDNASGENDGMGNDPMGGNDPNDPGMTPECNPMLMPNGCVGPSGAVLPCANGGLCREIEVINIDKLDLLFVIDDSGSMREEHEALRAQFPRLILALTTGDFDTDGNPEHPAVKDIHLAVVSSNMGSVGVQVPADKCDGFGDDGLFQHAPSPNLMGCYEAYPPFLTYTAGISAPEQTTLNLACLSDLGTNGCGFEQPLEAALKALSPTGNIDPATGMMPIQFLADANGNGALGHGDREHNGFLRNDPLVGLSVISVVVLADEDDCSSQVTDHFDLQLLQSDPSSVGDINLACFLNPQNLYPVDRYVQGLHALRPGQERLVLFTAIAGVPPDLAGADALSLDDARNPMLRQDYYQRLLDDPRMQEQVEMRPEGLSTLLPACTSASGTATPARRLVETARQFGENGLVQSICQQDYGQVIDAIADRVGAQAGAPCIDVALTRAMDGTVDCEVLWELPPIHMAGPQAPTRCSQPGFEFLSAAPDRMAPNGGVICTVAQVPVEFGRLIGPQPSGEGWYYDDFSEVAEQECTNRLHQRIAFTPSAHPPTGVRVTLDCN